MDARDESAALAPESTSRSLPTPEFCGRPAKTTGKPCRQRPHNRLPVACSRHMTDEERAQALRLDREFRAAWDLTDEEIDAIVPACWLWPPPDDLAVLAGRHPFHEKGGGWCDEEIHSRAALLAWHEGRCAFCEASDEVLVEDHDHDTGLVRGFLCRRCNAHEGHSKHEITGPFAKYRERPPAVILNLRRPYRHPLTGELAQPRPTWPVGDSWGEDNPLYGIGL